MSIPKFRAFKFNPIKINDKKFVPVVVETSQAQHNAKPPYVIFSDWFDKVISLTPSPHSEIMISTTKPNGDKYNKGYFSSGLSAPKSYACGFIDGANLQNAQIHGCYEKNESPITIESTNSSDDNINAHYEEAIKSIYDDLDDTKKANFLKENNSNFSRSLFSKLTHKEVATASSKPDPIRFKLQRAGNSFLHIHLTPGVPKTVGKQDLKDLFNQSNQFSQIPEKYLQLCYYDNKLFVRDLSNLGTNLKDQNNIMNLNQGEWREYSYNSQIHTNGIDSLTISKE